MSRVLTYKLLKPPRSGNRLAQINQSPKENLAARNLSEVFESESQRSGVPKFRRLIG
jgi:hypothetical protein